MVAICSRPNGLCTHVAIPASAMAWASDNIPPVNSSTDIVRTTVGTARLDYLPSVRGKKEMAGDRPDVGVVVDNQQ